MHSYIQPIKNKVRHKVVNYAVDNLTLNRNNAPVVSRNYVRNVYDHFMNLEEESLTKVEVGKIDKSFILEWEQLYDSINGCKRPSELTVCYLCGPEPNNDFQEFIDMGVLPQNIWAFEMNKDSYHKALSSYDEGVYPQPRIIRQNIETFFKNTPKKFDIVYIDACGAIPSNQHAIKCIKELFLNVRLNSPGILITNFSVPNISENIEEYIELICYYLYFKRNDSKPLEIKDNKVINKEFLHFKEEISENFKKYYSDFVSMLIRDIAFIIVPVQRIKTNPYFAQLFGNKKGRLEYRDLFEMAKNNNMAKFVFSMNLLKENHIIGTKIELLFNEIGSLEDLYYGFEYLVRMQNNKLDPNKDIQLIIDYFKNNNVFQFLDKIRENTFIDIVVNQLTYPMHYNSKQNYRCSYISKQRRMMLDVTTLDECRYIYEWLPAMHQIKSAFVNESWQYVFRFALDGLVKSRINYNNELFFQSSVISNREKGFECYSIPMREEIL